MRVFSDGIGAATRGLRVEIDDVVGVCQHAIEVRAHADAFAHGGQGAQFRLAAANENRVRHDHRIVTYFYSTLLDDRQDGADVVLVGAHASRDAVHDDADSACFHLSKSSKFKV